LRPKFSATTLVGGFDITRPYVMSDQKMVTLRSCANAADQVAEHVDFLVV